MQINVENINSQVINKMSYDMETEQLFVDLKGRNYVYSNVNKETFTELLLADSKGSYFATMIKPYHQVKKVQTIPVCQQLNVLIPC